MSPFKRYLYNFRTIRFWLQFIHYHIIVNVSGYAAKAGITLIPATYLTDKANFVLPDWLGITLGYTEVQKNVLSSYSERLGKQFSAGYTFTSFTWEPTIFLPYLQQQFLNAGGTIVNKCIEFIEELCEFNLVVNCTGLGAQLLTGEYIHRTEK